MPLILHIGYHKTGSTAIQSFLTANRDELAGQNVIVPTGLSHWLGHPELAWAFEAEPYPWQDKAYNKNEVLEYYSHILDTQCELDRKIIISSEEFCRLEFDLNAMLDIRSYLEKYNPVIVGYGRSPMAFLLSRYRHEVQEGGETRTLRRFLADFDNMQSAAFYYRAQVWRRLFPDRCLFFDYEESCRSYGSISKHFAHACGIIGNLPDSYSDHEKKIHPLLLDIVRIAKHKSFGNMDTIMDHVFRVSESLPTDLNEDILEGVGVSQDIIDAIKSIRSIISDSGKTVDII